MDETVPPFQYHPGLMQNRVKRILLVCSRYDSFVMEEDGGLADQIQVHFLELALSNSPHTTRVDSVAAAVVLLQRKRFDMIISIHQEEDESLFETYNYLRGKVPSIPIFPVFQSHGRVDEAVRQKNQHVLRFYWNGDATLFLSIIKLVEDEMNLAPDTEKGVRLIVYIEDEPQYYSAILPSIFHQLFHCTQDLMDLGFNVLQRIQKMRSRPKICLATNYEDAEKILTKYSSSLLGVISDMRIPKGGLLTNCGVELKTNFAAHVPALFISSEEDGALRAMQCGASFVPKATPNFSKKIRSFIRNYLGYGAFVFRQPPDLREIGRAVNLDAFYELLPTMSDEAIIYHTLGNHFSNWFLAHGEFWLSNFVCEKNWKGVSAGGIVARLRSAIEANRQAKRKGLITDFHYVMEHPDESFFTKIGNGSLGGKARGLLFMDRLIKESQLSAMFPGVVIDTPNTLVLTTDVCTKFLEQNDLHLFTDPLGLMEVSDQEIMDCFLASRMDDDTLLLLKRFLQVMKRPLAVRSSGMSEDSRRQHMAGIFSTYIIPNAERPGDEDFRYLQLISAVKLVFASAFLESARNILKSFNHSLGIEKMAVIIQEVVGEFQGNGMRYYPTVSGVASSWNFYAMNSMQPEDGVAHVVLGLGKALDDGMYIKVGLGAPRSSYLHSPQDYLKKTQRKFWSVDMSKSSHQLFLSNSRAVEVSMFLSELRKKYEMRVLMSRSERPEPPSPNLMCTLDPTGTGMEGISIPQADTSPFNFSARQGQGFGDRRSSRHSSLDSLDREPNPAVSPSFDSRRGSFVETTKGEMTKRTEASFLGENVILAAEEDGSLHKVGSVYSRDSEGLVDSIYGNPRKLIRLVTFRRMLQQQTFPLAEILSRLLKIANDGLGGPVEIEFAINLEKKPVEFIVLQLRPQIMLGANSLEMACTPNGSSSDLRRKYVKFLDSDSTYLITEDDKKLSRSHLSEAVFGRIHRIAQRRATISESFECGPGAGRRNALHSNPQALVLAALKVVQMDDEVRSRSAPLEVDASSSSSSSAFSGARSRSTSLSQPQSPRPEGTRKRRLSGSDSETLEIPTITEVVKFQPYIPRFLERVFCLSNHSLGHSCITDICDIVYVKRETFDRTKTKQIAEEVAIFNSSLVQSKTPFVAISLGRWGTKSHSLGIPVDIQDISGAKVFIEMALPSYNIDASYGSHFLDHVSQRQIPYLQVSANHSDIHHLSSFSDAERKIKRRGEFFDWDWLENLPIRMDGEYVRHVCNEEPLLILVNGERCRGLILKGNP